MGKLSTVSTDDWVKRRRSDLTRSEKLEEKHKIYILKMSRKQERLLHQH